jgi:two-component system sensor histidine kinase DctS
MHGRHTRSARSPCWAGPQCFASRPGQPCAKLRICFVQRSAILAPGRDARRPSTALSTEPLLPSPPTADPPAEPRPAAVRWRRWRRTWPWVLLVALLLVAQVLLLWLTANYEQTRAQEEVELVAANAAGDVRQALASDVQSLQALLWNDPSLPQWREDASTLMRNRRELMRLERRDTRFAIQEAVDSPYHPPLFSMIAREDLDLEAEVACTGARRLAGPTFSRSYFVPLQGGLGMEVTDVCLPVLQNGAPGGTMIATISLGVALEHMTNPNFTRTHEVSFVEGDGTRLARAGLPRGAGVYVAERLVDLPGLTLALRVDSATGGPRLIPNLATALVLGLSLALSGLVWLLVRDVRKRAAAERRLAEALALRRAMEDSLVAGLRARDLQGRITYVNPAFCDMVGFSSKELLGSTIPPYWPPEMVEEYTRRQRVRLSGNAPPREGFETVFMHRNGERFPVMIYEAPLVDADGRQTGWMSAALDIRAQRRAEELSRQQQEKLQATARLATVGEMASLLSHELNQPLAAIASYATGTLNLIPSSPADETLALIRQATGRIAEQAERAGRVIKSVHNFVRRREQLRESLRADHLIDAVLPLVRLQARKSGTRIELDLPQPIPRVTCDRTMVEQVLLNLTRNAIQAMEVATPLEDRVLTLQVRAVAASGHESRWVSIAVRDRGPGIPEEVAQRLFTPFFTTKSEGMGLGLSLCRTVIEQHGGALVFESINGAGGQVVGTEFRFTLPAALSPADEPAAAAPGAVTEAPPPP